LAIWLLKYFYETFVQGSTVGILLNFFVLKIRPIAKPENVTCKLSERHQLQNKDEKKELDNSNFDHNSNIRYWWANKVNLWV
jgi:hypothetical protein